MSRLPPRFWRSWGETKVLKVLQASAWYPPDQLGGTEVYLEGLVQSLRALQIESTILVPRSMADPQPYDHQGVNVVCYPSQEMAGGRSASLGHFEHVLRQSGADIYHQHAWTPDCGSEHLGLARRMGLSTVLTVHTPGNGCLRGTMMLHGETACDGLIQDQRCGRCWAESRGAPTGVAAALGALPLGVARRFLGMEGSIFTALSARALAERKKGEFDEMVENADRVVAVCQWLYDSLASNGVPAEKLVLSRQGLTDQFIKTARRTAPRPHGSPLRLLYLGRWHPVKGVDLLVRALRTLPAEVPVELTIHAISGGVEEEAYRAKVLAMIGGDPRIVVGVPLSRDELPRAMSAFDALAVPSIWLETGPLVVLEAQAAGLYILGSDLGGIAELVDSPTSGTLVPAGDVDAWVAAIGKLARAPVAPDVGPVPHVRSINQAASDMSTLYRAIL